MFKKILFGLLGLIGLYLVLCLFGPTKLDVTATKTLKADPELVYSQFIDFRAWPNWSKWMKEDSTMKLSFGNPAAGLGGTYSWTSPKSGSGSMKITGAEAPRRMTADLQFSDWNSVNRIIIECNPKNEGTEVTWKMFDEKPFPFVLRGMMLFMNMNKAIQKDFEEGLSNMEVFLQSGKAGRHLLGYTIHEGQFPGGDYLGKRVKLSFQEVPAFFETHMPKLGQAAGPAMRGAPVGLFWDWNEATQQTDMAAAVPVGQAITHPEYSMMNVPAGPEFTVDYFGAYEKTSAAYAALDSMLIRKGIPFPRQVIEEYITDPGAEKDTAQWLTRIHFLVGN
jgi:effector-binding domain-containing protein